MQSMSVRFMWSASKNELLVGQRGISFENVIDAMEQGGLINVRDHPNQDRYPGQSVYVVEVAEYLYLVPFVTEADGTRFLKTVIPSRKAMRYYWGR